MRILLGLALFITTFAMPALAQPAPDTPSQVEQPEQPTSQVPILGRPTSEDDPPPLLDFGAYFGGGAWNFTWDYPDSVLGPAGALTGSTEYTSTDDRFFEATTEATDENGNPVTIHETIAYLKDNATIARTVRDSRGLSFFQIGTVGGDLGGQFTIHYDSAPFEHDGHTMRIRTTVRLLSPYNYRVHTVVSEDGGPFLNHGNPWWRKEVSGSAGR